MAAGAAVVIMLTTGCGSPGSTGGSATYAPAAYGAGGDCYYITYPAEVTALIAAGKCAAGSVAVQAPLAWEEEYWPYYDSAAFTGTYVPAADRTAYTSGETAFGKTYRTVILTRSKLGTYKSSTGSTVHGYKTGTVHFGSGTSFGSSGQKYGGGSLRGHAGTSKTGTSTYHGSTGGGTYHGGYGGGSLRGGGLGGAGGAHGISGR